MKRKPYDPHPLGLTCDECESPFWSKGKCIVHYARQRTVEGKRTRYPFICIVCHCPGDSLDTATERHADCQRRTTVRPLTMSKCTDIAIIESRRYLARPVNILPKGQILFAGKCWHCGAEWVDYVLRHSCSDDCRDALDKNGQRRARRKRKDLYEEQGLPRGYGRARHRSRARRYGVDYESGITPLSVFEGSKWICQLCFGPVDPRECTGLWRPTIDHITPLSRGGHHTRDNLQLAHLICNSYKRDTLP